MINPSHLKTLRAVLESGSFADAGRTLGYTPSAVSQHIQALERSTGLLLFDRLPHCVQPTTAALSLSVRAQASLTALEELEHDAQMLATGSEGRLRIGAFTSSSICVVPPAISNFMVKRPRTEIELVEDEPGELVVSLLAGDLDLVLVYEYQLVPTVWPSSLTVRDVLEEKMVLLVPSDHDLAVRPHISLRDLADEAWITSGPETAGSVALDRLCAMNGFAPRVAFRSDSFGVVRSLVECGLGVSMVPQLGHRRSDRIKSSSFDQGVTSRMVKVLYRSNLDNPLLKDAIRAICAAAADETLDCTAPPGWCDTRPAVRELGRNLAS